MSSFIGRNVDGPILVHLPHNSTTFPDDFVYRRSGADLARDVHALVDHHTELLFEPLGGTSIVNPYCRIFSIRNDMQTHPKR